MSSHFDCMNVSSVLWDRHGELEKEITSDFPPWWLWWRNTSHVASFFMYGSQPPKLHHVILFSICFYLCVFWPCCTTRRISVPHQGSSHSSCSGRTDSQPLDPGKSLSSESHFPGLTLFCGPLPVWIGPTWAASWVLLTRPSVTLQMRSAKVKWLRFPSVGSHPLGEGSCHAVWAHCGPVKRHTPNTHRQCARPGSEPPWKWTRQRGSRLHTPTAMTRIFSATHDGGFPGGKEPTCQCRSARDLSSLPGSGRAPRVGNGNLPQCSCWNNPVDRGATNPETLYSFIPKSETDQQGWAFSRTIAKVITSDYDFYASRSIYPLIKFLSVPPSLHCEALFGRSAHLIYFIITGSFCNACPWTHLTDLPMMSS